METVFEKTVPAFNSGLRELYPLFCGCEDCAAGHAFGPAIRDYYLIHFVRSGRGIFSVRGTDYPVTAGQCFIIRPDESTRYQADTARPWRYTWIAFAGDRAASFLSAAGFDRMPVFRSEALAGTFAGLYEQILSGGLDGFGNELRMLSALYAILAALPQQEPVGSQKDIYIRKVCNYVNQTLTNRITVQSLASYCGLDRHYLCRIFRERTGFSLQDYVLDCKMRKAKDMLLATALRVGDVARSVGYADPFLFSRMFKKRFGLSPARLRQAKSGG